MNKLITQYSKYVAVILLVGLYCLISHYLPKNYGVGMPHVPWPIEEEDDLAEMREEALKEWAKEEGYIKDPSLL